MNLSIHNQALLRGILAGAAVLSGVSACSRSDRSGTGRDATQSGATTVTPPDSQTSASSHQPYAGAATQPSGDTATATAQTRTPRQRTTPSGRRARQDTTVKSGEVAVSGYRGMEQDTSPQPPSPAPPTRSRWRQPIRPTPPVPRASRPRPKSRMPIRCRTIRAGSGPLRIRPRSGATWPGTRIARSRRLVKCRPMLPARPQWATPSPASMRSGS